MKMVSYLAALLALALLLPLAGRADNDPGEVVTARLKLSYAEPNALVRLLSGASDNPDPKEAQEERRRRSLVPEGIRGLVGYPQERAMYVQGTPQAIERLRRAVQVADTKRDDLGNGRVRMALTPTPAHLERLDRAVRALPGAGAVEVKAGRLMLEGTLAWVDESLRSVIRLEVVREMDGQP
jgi:hypothetical protein